MRLLEASLDDKYSIQRGRVYLSGVQALVRLLLLQRQRDLAAGLNTAGFRLRLPGFSDRAARQSVVGREAASRGLPISTFGRV